jgi:DNA-nicking Smr family endonuclease
MTGPPGKRPVSETEQRLWETVTNNVKPLSENRAPENKESWAENPGRGKDAPKQESSQPDPDPDSKPTLLQNKPSPPSNQTPDMRKESLEREAGETTGMDRRTANRLRRGQLPVDGELDLHGFKQAQAHQTLDRFIEKAAREGRRCLLVITGKGARAGVEKGWRGAGVLREAVPSWLNDPVNRDRIISFCHAQPRDGGDGALYVLLKRRRQS